MRNPPLVLVSELVRPIYATHSEDGCPNAIRSRVIEHVLFSRARRATVRAVEIQGRRFVDGGIFSVGPNVPLTLSSKNEVRERTVYLARRGIYQAGRMRRRTYL